MHVVVGFFLIVFTALFVALLMFIPYWPYYIAGILLYLAVVYLHRYSVRVREIERRKQNGNQA